MQNAKLLNPTLTPVALKKMNSRFRTSGPLYPHKSLWETPRYSSRYRLRVSRAVREEVEELTLHWQSRARRQWLSCRAQYLWTMAFILNRSASILLVITPRNGDTVHVCTTIAAYLYVRHF